MQNNNYQILDLLQDEASEVKDFTTLLHRYTGTKVAFLDIVSVEKKQNKEYNVDWFGRDKPSLINYYNIIDNYFKQENDNKISLLFLEDDIDKKGKARNKFFPVNINAKCGCEIDFSFKMKAKFELLKMKNIPRINEETHFVQWTNEVLSKMCISYATFTKIEFSIQDRPFVAAIWIGYNEGTSNVEKDFVYNIIVENFLWSYSTKSIASNLIRDVELQATRAAITQVMARNTSHNVGAHVMNKLIGDLSNMKIEGFTNYESEITLYDSGKTDQEKLLDQISNFNNYLKCRMDYLADISFGTPLMQTNKNAYTDLFKELDKVRLLLEHISGLDDFTFQIEFRRNGTRFRASNKDKEENSSEEFADDLLVAIPNDILGIQAFYNILENIIRNSAKHSDKSKLGKNEKVVFIVNFIDDVEKVDGYCKDEKCDRTKCDKTHQNEIENALNEFIAVEVYDNIQIDANEREVQLDEREIREYKRMMGNVEPKFKTYIDHLVFSQNQKLNEDILQENKLRSYSLGLVEMDASAAYLRKRPVEYINHSSYDIQYDESWSRDTEKNRENTQDPAALRGSNCRHFLKAFKKTEDGKNYLGYRFFLHRPAVVLVVTNVLENDKEKRAKLRKEGIWVITPVKFMVELNAGKVYPHEFVIYEETADHDICVKDIVEKYKTSLPIRILNTITNISEILIKSADKIYEECWVKWEIRLKNKYQYSEYSNGQYPILNGKKAKISNHLQSNEKNKSPNDIWKELKQNSYFVEPASSKSQSYLPGLKNKNLIKYPTILRENVIYKIQIAEALLANIFVLDERVQHGCDQKPMGILQHKVYQAMRIFVPRKIYLANSSLDVSAILKIINDKIQCCDIILLHYSILERMFNDETNRLKAINDFLIVLSKQVNVVVTSGRGIPDKLPSEVRFINLSSVIMAFNEVRGKYLINYLLNSSRKTNRI